MKTIEVSDQTYSALEAQVSGFGETPETVIQRLLRLQATLAEGAAGSIPAGAKVERSAIETFVSSADFQHKNGKGRYLSLLGFLIGEDFQKFETVALGLRRGKRVQISDSPDHIENSGKSTFPERIPNTNYWALTNLSNRSKRDVIYTAMTKLGYGEQDIRIAVQSIPDSGIDRSSYQFVTAGSKTQFYGGGVGTPIRGGPKG